MTAQPKYKEEREALLAPPTRVRLSRPLQKTYMRFLGMPRSGTHAVMNWLAYRFGKRVCYVDEKQKHSYSIPPQDSQRLPAFAAGISPAGSGEQKDLLIHGFEWKPCNMVFNPFLKESMRHGVGDWERKLNVLVLRDPYNLAASMRKKRTDNAWQPIKGEKRAGAMLRMWTDHAVWFLEHQDDPDTLCINYNKWVASPVYRESLCKKAAVPFDNRGIDDVSDYAAGSSFDGLTKKGSEMDVLNRWKVMLDDDLYLWMFARWSEVREMSRLVFGEHPAEEALYSKASDNLK